MLRRAFKCNLLYRLLLTGFQYTCYYYSHDYSLKYVDVLGLDRKTKLLKTFLRISNSL